MKKIITPLDYLPACRNFYKKALFRWILLFFVFYLSYMPEVYAQGCTGSTNHSSMTAPAAGNFQIISGVSPDSYITMNGATTGADYIVRSTVATDYITVRQGSPG